MKLKSKAFTLVELLVVCAIIGILASALLAALAKASASKQRIACQNNQRQLFVAWQCYVDSNAQRLPWGFLLDPRLPESVLAQDDMRPYIGNTNVYLCPSRNTSWDMPGQAFNWLIGGYPGDLTETTYFGQVVWFREGQIKDTSRLFFIIDISGSAFAPPVSTNAWNSQPSTSHNRCAALTFLDGHGEVHKCSTDIGWTIEHSVTETQN